VARVARQQPNGVITLAERQLPLAAALAAQCDLRFHSSRSAELLVNKCRQRVALAPAQVPGPGFWPVSADADPATRERLASALPYPVVLKPQEGSGSRHTSQVPNAAGLVRLLDDASARGDDILVEELLAEARPRDE